MSYCGPPGPEEVNRNANRHLSGNRNFVREHRMQTAIPQESSNRKPQKKVAYPQKKKSQYQVDEKMTQDIYH